MQYENTQFIFKLNLVFIDNVFIFMSSPVKNPASLLLYTVDMEEPGIELRKRCSYTGPCSFTNNFKIY